MRLRQELVIVLLFIVVVVANLGIAREKSTTPSNVKAEEASQGPLPVKRIFLVVLSRRYLTFPGSRWCT